MFQLIALHPRLFQVLFLSEISSNFQIEYYAITSSVASILAWGGGGGEDPQMYPTKIYVCEQVEQASLDNFRIFTF